MNGLSRLVILTAALAAITCLAADPLKSSAEPKLSIDQVLSIARKAAEAEGASLSKYKEPKVRFNLERRKWKVFFDSKPVNGLYTIGDHFDIEIDDSTGEASVIPGL
jgi:hypothetical protein